MLFLLTIDFQSLKPQLIRAYAEDRWDGPLWIHSLEIPRERGESPRFESSRFILSCEQNDEHLNLLVERRGPQVHLIRLAPSPNAGMILKFWKQSFVKNHRIRKNLLIGDLAVDLISRLEDSPRLESLEELRLMIPQFWNDIEKKEIASGRLRFPKQIIKEAIQEKLPIVNQHPLSKIEAPRWELLIGLIFVSQPVKDESNLESSQYYEIPDHQSIALVGLIDRNESQNHVFGYLSIDQKKRYLNLLVDNDLARELVQIFLIKDFDHGLKKWGLFKILKLFHIDQIKSSASLLERGPDVDSRLHLYATHKVQNPLLKRLQWELERFWTARRSVPRQELNLSSDEILPLVQEHHIGSIRLERKSSGCRSSIRNIPL
jgi:hypothetical protein